MFLSAFILLIHKVQTLCALCQGAIRLPDVQAVQLQRNDDVSTHRAAHKTALCLALIRIG